MSASFGSFQSEDIFTGAIREVKEETGVRIFLNIITMNIVAC
jgi:8-oxo-dGTP pyrophosphatase MutT (NUDIX family)